MPLGVAIPTTITHLGSVHLSLRDIAHLICPICSLRVIPVTLNIGLHKNQGLIRMHLIFLI